MNAFLLYSPYYCFTVIIIAGLHYDNPWVVAFGVFGFFGVKTSYTYHGDDKK